MDHGLMLQTVIEEEALLEMGKTGLIPHTLIICTGQGSNFQGTSRSEKKADREEWRDSLMCETRSMCTIVKRGVLIWFLWILPARCR